MLAWLRAHPGGWPAHVIQRGIGKRRCTTAWALSGLRAHGLVGRQMQVDSAARWFALRHGEALQEDEQ